MEVNTIAVGAPPMVSDYDDYREFMRAAYDSKRAARSGFSYRRFSQLAGLKSPNFLQMVMTGKRNLSNDLAPAIAKVLCKSVAEQNYFVALVKKENAGTSREIEDANKQMMVAIRRILTKEVPKEQSAILSHWYFMVIRELVFLPGFQANGTWISERLRGLITPQQAEEGLATLIKAGFLKFKDGKYEPVDPFIDSGDTLLNHYLLKGHLSVFQAWSKILPSISQDDRELGYLNIPVSTAKIPEFKERIRRFQDEIIGWLHGEVEPDQVVQLGTYLIPITAKE